MDVIATMINNFISNFSAGFNSLHAFRPVSPPSLPFSSPPRIPFFPLTNHHL